MRPRAIVALLLAVLALAALPGPASAGFEEGRVAITPTLGHITFDATPPWSSIKPTVLYGGRLGVMVNRWVGVDANFGVAFANGEFGYREDGSGGFVPTTVNGTHVQVAVFGLDLTFHPMEGRIDPYALVGVSFLRYDYDFDSAGFKDWLSENGATYDLGDFASASGYEFGAGVAWAYRVTDTSRWAVVADIRDMVVSPKKLEIIDADGEKVLDGKSGHNILFTLGFEFSWGYTGSPAEGD